VDNDPPRVPERGDVIARLVLAVILTIAVVPAGADDTRFVALTNANVLLAFSAADPGRVERLEVKGVRGTLVGIDCRPADGRLYALGTTYDLYTIDPASGAAAAASTLTIPFDGGARSGIDFNPQADRLRLVAASGQNLRVNVTMGATAADAGLAYAAGDRNRGRRPSVTAAAYTNNRPDAATTRLFDIDAELDVLALQDPPNDGALVTVGDLGVDVGPHAGFDIVSDATGTDRAFAAFGSSLYTIDLASGAARQLGAIGGSPDVVGLAALDACTKR
jgi:hypothetical protein